MMKQQWKSLSNKVDSMALRERALIFAVAAFALASLIKATVLDPLLVEQKKLSEQVVKQQKLMGDIQTQIQASVQAQKDFEHSPTKIRLENAKQQLSDSNFYLQSYRERLVAPDKMAELLEQVLNQNGRLQLIKLNTLPVTPLLEKMGSEPAPSPNTMSVLDKRVFKHGVEITIRGSYLDLLQYLDEIENLPTQMFWGNADMRVEQYPAVRLTLTLYTLSLDETWLKI